MSKVSRRSQARYAADQLIAGKSAAVVARDLAALLIESGQAGQIDFLLGDITWELEQQGELAAAKITTATPLSQELERELKVQLKKATKTREIILDKNIDKSVIGGVRIETPGRVWDGTVSTKLRELREAF